MNINCISNILFLILFNVCVCVFQVCSGVLGVLFSQLDWQFSVRV